MMEKNPFKAKQSQSTGCFLFNHSQNIFFEQQFHLSNEEFKSKFKEIVGIATDFLQKYIVKFPIAN